MSFEEAFHSKPQGQGIEQGRVPADTREQTYHTAERILSTLEQLPGYEEFSNITSMYRSLPDEELVVRREHPETLLSAFSSDEPLEISFVGGTPYANSVAWNPHVDTSRGLDNAFLEGYSHLDRIVTVFGFKKPDDFYFQEQADTEKNYSTMDRSRVRTAAGFVPKDAIKFVTVRIPIQAFPEADMTEDEKDALWDYEHQGEKIKKPVFIYRGFKQKAADPEMAA